MVLGVLAARILACLDGSVSIKRIFSNLFEDCCRGSAPCKRRKKQLVDHIAKTQKSMVWILLLKIVLYCCSTQCYIAV